MRTIGSEEGRAKKPCESPESHSPALNANQFPSSSQQNMAANIANRSDPEFNGHSHNPTISSDNTTSSPSTTRGPSQSTLWRRAQKAKEKKQQQKEQAQSSQGDAESNWEDIEKLVEEKWPMVAREIRATVLKKGIIILNPIVNGFEKDVTNMSQTVTKQGRLSHD